MKKEVAIKLKDKANDIAIYFSDTDREFNFNNETFDIVKIEPLSESTATILFKKSTGKYAMCFCYYIKMSGGIWQYFFPTYDHCIGMESVKSLLSAVEKSNFDKNFK